MRVSSYLRNFLGLWNNVIELVLVHSVAGPANSSRNTAAHSSRGTTPEARGRLRRQLSPRLCSFGSDDHGALASTNFYGGTSPIVTRKRGRSEAAVVAATRRRRVGWRGVAIAAIPAMVGLVVSHAHVHAH